VLVAKGFIAIERRAKGRLIKNPIENLDLLTTLIAIIATVKKMPLCL
jgi:hypothetical protein